MLLRLLLLRLMMMMLLLLLFLSGNEVSFNIGNAGGGEGLMLTTANADGERQCRRDSAMDTDTACDFGDVVMGGGKGGVNGDEGGGESGGATVVAVAMSLTFLDALEGDIKFCA